jgi:hypothetical protein
MLQTGGTALLSGPAGTGIVQPPGQAAPLPRHRFCWGVGIENLWIAQTNPAKDGDRRLLDVYLQMNHYERWKADLDLAKEVGFRHSL